MPSASCSLALVAAVGAALTSLGGIARAADPLYLGQRHHVRFELGESIFFDADSPAENPALSPIVSGRVALSDRYGLSLVIPTAFASFLIDEAVGMSGWRFKLGNPALAFELVDDAQEYKRAVFRFGVGLPAASLSEDNLGDRFLDASTYGAASLGRGNVDPWLWAPDTLGLVAEFHTTAFIIDLFVDLRFSAAGLIPTADGDFQLVLQSVMRFGYGPGVVIPFGGLTLVWVPTADGDAFQSGLQAGAIFVIGGPSIDVALQVNLDDPGGFLFDGGVLGVHVGGTIPF